MKLLFWLALGLATVSCSKPDPVEEGDYMPRPDTYRISPVDAQNIERGGLADEKIPMEFKSPMRLRDILATEASVKSDLRSLRGAAARADQTLERMVRFAAWMLKRKGFPNEANQITSEYFTQFSGFMLDRETRRDLGDHAPLLTWLDVWYVKLEGILGPVVMRATNLEHLKILNYAIPVVFNPTGKDNDTWNIDEYRAHFAGTRDSFFYPRDEHNGFAGVVTYWAVWGACTAATYGAGGILPFICAPVGEVSCYGMGKYLAPKISDFVFCRYSVCE